VVWKSRLVTLGVFVFLVGVASARSDAAHYEVLHWFTGSANDGGSPQSPLDTDGTTLYGASTGGGSFGLGAVYSLHADGTVFSRLASVDTPVGGVTSLGSTLYSTSYYGGVGQFGGNGRVFALNTDGSNLHDVHAFTNSEGSKPDTPLFRSGSTLYGTVPVSQSDNNFGSVFKVDGSGFQIVRAFTGGFSDGTRPENVSVIGSQIYGSNSSQVFRMDTNGSNLQLLDVAAAAGPLMGIDLTVFGLGKSPATFGGDNALFSMNLDGTGLQILHEFHGGANDGKFPLGNMVVLDGDIYGITSQGGAGNSGTLWKSHPNGTGFQVLHSFLGGASDGSFPIGGLTLIGSTLYGQTFAGGSGTHGTIFSLAVPEPASIALWGIGMLGVAVYGWRKRRRAAV
jgi:uncharacterized repeat protein (TIGR03803 family)